MPPHITMIQPTRHRLIRILVPISFLLFIAIMAALLNSRYGHSFGLQFIQHLAEYELFHIAAHIVIFATVVIMIAWVMPDPYFKWAAWGFVLVGTLLIEAIQISSAFGGFRWWLVGASLYDLVINTAGATLGMIIVRVWSR